MAFNYIHMMDRCAGHRRERVKILLILNCIYIHPVRYIFYFYHIACQYILFTGRIHQSWRFWSGDSNNQAVRWKT